MVDEFKKTPQACSSASTAFGKASTSRRGLVKRDHHQAALRRSDRPVIAARLEAIQQSGGQPFFDYQVPLAVIKLKQGFGRLIRSKTDTGLVVILDPRVLTKGYGRTFLEALPDCRQFVDGKPVGELTGKPLG